MEQRTERPNEYSADADLMPIPALLNLINAEDHLPALAVRRALPAIERVVRQIVARFPLGGRLLYVGAGTSGRLAFMDAAECPPTFGIEPERIAVLMAGGREAVFRAAEGREDEAREAVRQVEAWRPGELDCVIGLAASGRTPFVRAGLATARRTGAYTALICSNPVEDDGVDALIVCDTGPEVLTGSTRMKAGTAAKMALNMISTAAMIALGHTYGNRMCHIRAANGKLSRRALTVLADCCALAEDEAEALLSAAHGELAAALTMGLTGADFGAAREALKRAGGRVRDAVRDLAKHA